MNKAHGPCRPTAASLKFIIDSILNLNTKAKNESYSDRTQGDKGTWVMRKDAFKSHCEEDKEVQRRHDSVTGRHERGKGDYKLVITQSILFMLVFSVSDHPGLSGGPATTDRPIVCAVVLCFIACSHLT